MAKRKIPYLLIDFDSTFVKVEALDELAKIVLRKRSNSKQLLRRIKKITKLGMEGKIAFNDSLAERLELFKPKKEHLRKLVKVLRNNITESVIRNKEFFKTYAKRIFVVSGGFKEWIIPVVREFGIDKSRVLAYEFKFDKSGKMAGFSGEEKYEQVRQLSFKGEVVMMGDGYTDFLIKKKGLAQEFLLFGENIRRREVVAVADSVLPNFDEFLYKLDLPRALSYPKHRIKVLLLENIHESAAKVFGEEGYSVESIPQVLTERQLLGKIAGVSILGVRSKTKLSGQVFKRAKRLLAVGAFCIGTDNVDLRAASERGVAVFNAPYSSTRSVAELVIGQIIALSRGVMDKSAAMHKGIWRKSSNNSYELRGKRLGIVGYGNIGSQVSVLAELLGMKVYFFDKVERLALGGAVKVDSLDDLLGKVDVVSVHAGENGERGRIFGKREFEAMKAGAIFINLSSGSLVDEKALANYVKRGEIRGAALDVFENEPARNESRFSSALQGLSKVILTPHIGGSTQEAEEKMGEFVARKLKRFVNTGNTDMSCNLPKVSLGEQKGTQRLIYLHKNEPGVLAEVNRILARHKLNIEGQYLKTDENYAYVITDVRGRFTKKVLDKLKEFKATVKLRVLF